MNLPFINKLAALSGKVRRNFWPYCQNAFFLFSHYKKIRMDFLQRSSMLSRHPPQAGAELVVLLFPRSILNIAGGLFSILNIASMSRKLLGNDRKVLVVYFPGHDGLAKYPYFPNEEIIYTFKQLIRLFPKPESLIVHIPECHAAKAFNHVNSREVSYLKSARHLHINILNQNIQLMPSMENLTHLKVLTPHLTQTTAHSRSNSQETADSWNTPVLHLSAVFWKDYPFVPYEEKKNWIAYSPDQNPLAKAILLALRSHLPHFRFIKISGVSYNKYLKIISQSKYVISFGEGWDGYFFEPYYCGTLGCTARNDVFFPKEMGYWETLYSSYQDMLLRLPADIVRYEKNNSLYLSYCKLKYDEIVPNLDVVWDYLGGQLKKFYSNEYDYYPKQLKSK